MNRNAATALYLLYEIAEPMTTAELADLVFSPDDEDEMRNAERKIRYYLETGYPHLVEKTPHDDDPAVYAANAERIWTGKGVMYVGDDSEVFSVDFGIVLVYVDCDGVPQTVKMNKSDIAPTVSVPDPAETDF